MKKNQFLVAAGLVIGILLTLASGKAYMQYGVEPEMSRMRDTIAHQAILIKGQGSDLQDTLSKQASTLQKKADKEQKGAVSKAYGHAADVCLEASRVATKELDDAYRSPGGTPRTFSAEEYKIRTRMHLAAGKVEMATILKSLFERKSKEAL